MRRLIFILLIFYLQVFRFAGSNKGSSAAGSFQKVDLLDKVGSEDRRLADIKETTFKVGTHGGTTSHKSPDTGETTGGGGGANNHHQSIRHSSSPPRLIVRDGVLLIASLLLLMHILPCR